MVKFIVNVKLVEKSLNSNVGRVIEVNVAAQYSRAGTRRTMTSARPPIIPSHDRDGLLSWAVANAEGREDAVFEAALRRKSEPVEPVWAVPGWAASMAGSRVGDHAACWMLFGRIWV